jgi:succinyl-diaminopimelate desuccinylase
METQILDEELDRWIQDNRDDMVKELCSWVSHPSVSRADLAEPGAPYGQDCREMLDYALERGRFFGFRTEDHEGYCGDIRYGEAEDEFGFVCHLDVVPEGEGWIYDPYHPVEKDGFVIGRGAEDNKGAAIQVLWAFRFFKEKQIPLSKTLRLMLGCAEETGMADYKHYLDEMNGKVPSMSIVADASFPVCFAQKGGYNASFLIPAGADIVEFRAGKVCNSIPDTATLVITGISLEAAQEALRDYPGIEVASEQEKGAVRIIGHGKSGHAAFPEGTRNAIQLLAEAVSQSGLTKQADLAGIEFIAQIFASVYGEGLGIGCEDEQSGKLTLNAGVISRQGNDLKVDIDIRFPVSCSAKWIGETIRETLKQWGVQITEVRISNPYYIDPQDDAVVTMSEIYSRISGYDSKPYAMGGGTYSKVIPNAISYGPGFPGAHRPEFLPEGHGNAHGPDEVLYIEDWLKGLKIYILTIWSLAGEKSSR